MVEGSSCIEQDRFEVRVRVWDQSKERSRRRIRQQIRQDSHDHQTLKRHDEDKARQDTRQDKTGQDKIRQDKTRQDKAHDKTQGKLRHMTRTD